MGDGGAQSDVQGPALTAAEGQQPSSNGTTSCEIRVVQTSLRDALYCDEVERAIQLRFGRGQLWQISSLGK
jgi:hypothetical protein